MLMKTETKNIIIGMIYRIKKKRGFGVTGIEEITLDNIDKNIKQISINVLSSFFGEEINLSETCIHIKYTDKDIYLNLPDTLEFIGIYNRPENKIINKQIIGYSNIKYDICNNKDFIDINIRENEIITDKIILKEELLRYILYYISGIYIVNSKLRIGFNIMDNIIYKFTNIKNDIIYNIYTPKIYRYSGTPLYSLCNNNEYKVEILWKTNENSIKIVLSKELTLMNIYISYIELEKSLTNLTNIYHNYYKIEFKKESCIIYLIDTGENIYKIDYRKFVIQFLSVKKEINKYIKYHK